MHTSLKKEPHSSLLVIRFLLFLPVRVNFTGPRSLSIFCSLYTTFAFISPVHCDFDNIIFRDNVPQDRS